MTNKYDIFISYRRDDGRDYAHILQKALQIRGYKVFLDFVELTDGIFDKKIKNAIKEASVFMMVLSPHYLERCKNEDDWVRQEIMMAIQEKKYIIPINPDRSFKGFPKDMPNEIIKAIGSYQFAEVDFGPFFEASIDMIVNSRFLNKSNNKSEKRDIFLAYSRKDINAGDKLTKIIQSNGFSVWRDVTSIMTGELFEDCIINAISNSKVFIALYSSWALDSMWFKKELEYAQNKKIPIIKVLTDTPEGLSGTRRMTFGSMLEMGSVRFEEKLLSNILNNGCKPVTTEIASYGKELYDNAIRTNNLQEESTSFGILMRAAELGDSEALSYIESRMWNIDLRKAISQYIPINSYFIEDLRADLYNRGEILAEDETVSDNTFRGQGMEKAAFRMMKRAIDLGFDGSDPMQYDWYYLTDKDFDECLNLLGESSKIHDNEKQKESVSNNSKPQQEMPSFTKDSANPITKNDNHRVFISYKRVDKDKVFEIKRKIESIIGEECWIDLDGIESDAQFAKVIIGAINRSVVFLFMYSSAHAAIEDYENDWTVRELNFAQKKRKRIVFINIDGSELTDWFEMIFGTKQQIDASSDILMNNLYSDLKKWLNVDDIHPSPQKTQNYHFSKQDNKEDSFEDSIELQLAWMEYNEGNYKEALRSFLLEAKKGSANALNAIGLYYYEGKGCSKNYQQAMSYFQRAADKGYASAMRNLGDCYRWGHGVKQDVEKAIYWYKKAAEKRNLKAIYLLAQSYRDISPIEADKYYLEAAHMGHEEAIKYVISHGLAKNEDDIKWNSYIKNNHSDEKKGAQTDTGEYTKETKEHQAKEMEINPLSPEINSKRFKKVFICCAREDMDKVSFSVNAFMAMGVDYFFDRDYLINGDVLPQAIKEYISSCDLFILFWSANAAKSEYVRLEYKYAMTLAYPQVTPQQAAKLVIYPMSIEPYAELPIDLRNIYHFGEI